MIPLPLAQLQVPGPEIIIPMAIVIFLAIGLHEFAHAKFADMAGDLTPGMYGRVTLNLFKHFELMGTIFIVITMLAGFGIGWGKPVPMNPTKMRNPKWDHFLAVLAGPVSNLIQAMIFAVVFHLASMVSPSLFAAEITRYLIGYGVLINLGLCFFNLIPLGPLDGMWLLGTFLPAPMRLRWTRFNLTYGGILFLGVILFSQASPTGGFLQIIIIPAVIVYRLLLGPNAFDLLPLPG